MRRYDPIYLSKYACDHDILDNPVWKQVFRYIKNTRKINCLLKCPKANQYRNTAKIKLGMNIARDSKEVLIFYSDNGKTNWKNT